MKQNIQRTVFIGVFAALLAVLSQLSIPLPSGIPVTLHTFTVALCGYMLGWRRGALALSVYVTMGAVGLPVFSAFSGGVGILFGVTGGFIWGFFPLVILCGIGTKQRYSLAVFSGLAGLTLCQLLGVLQFAAVSGVDILQAFLLACVPYLIKDIISVVLACGISRALKKALHKSGAEVTGF